MIQLDHSFYKVPGETQNLKVLTFVETVTSMSGAVIVPDLSANQVAIKALKKFIAVNGFTKSVLQCDGHSGLLALQEQVGQEMSLATQISPRTVLRTAISLKEPLKGFTRHCMGRSELSELDLQII